MKIYTLTLNPAVDRYAEIDRLRLFSENLLLGGCRYAGGKGLNSARALLAFGCPAEALLVLGEENKEEFLSLLGAGVSVIPIENQGRIRENLTIKSDKGRETRLSFGGFSADEGLLMRVYDALAARGLAGSFLSLAGRMPAGLTCEQLCDFARRLSAAGGRLLLDSRAFSLEMLRAVKPYFVKPNEEEIRALGFPSVFDLPSAAEAAAELSALGCRYAAVSLGERGAVLSSPRGVFAAETPKITPLSTVGAGDSMLAGFLYASSQKMSAEERLRYAMAFGSAACLREGTLPPLKEDILRLLPMIKVGKVLDKA